MILRLIVALLLLVSTAYAQKATMTLDDQGITSPLRVNPADGTCSQQNIEDAITEGATSGNKTILITREDRNGSSCTWAITSALTIPTDYALLVPNGSMLNISNGITLTINGALYAEDHQIFTGSGTVVIDRRTPVRAVWYGAVCDDTTDVAGPIQRAVNTASGNTVQLLSGICRIGTTIDISNGVTIEGRGHDISIIKPMPAANLSSIIRVQDTSTLIVIRNLTVDGNAALNPQPSQIGILANKYNGLLVDNVTTQNIGNTSGSPSGVHILLRCLEPSESESGYVVGGGCSKGVVQNSRLIDTGAIAGSGVLLSTNLDLNLGASEFTALVRDNEIKNNSFYDGFTFGSIVVGGPGTLHNQVRGNNLHDVMAGIVVRQGASKNHISGNTIDMVDIPVQWVSSIALQGAFNSSNILRETSDNEVIGNIIELLNAGELQDTGISVTLDLRTLIANNIIRVVGSTGSGIRFAGGNIRTVVQNNEVEANVGFYSHATNTLRDQSGLTVKGNIFRTDGNGLQVSFTDPSFEFEELVVQGNVIQPLSVDRGGIGILMSGRVDHAIVAYNVIKAMTIGIQVGGLQPLIKGTLMRDVTTPVVINSSASNVVRAENTCVSAGGVASSC